MEVRRQAAATRSHISGQQLAPADLPLPPFPITVPNASDPTTQHRYIFGQNGVTTVYQLATDGTVSGATQVCINLAANQTFIKPDRARMFVLSNFSGSDITTSISPAA